MEFLRFLRHVDSVVSNDLRGTGRINTLSKMRRPPYSCRHPLL